MSDANPYLVDEEEVSGNPYLATTIGERAANAAAAFPQGLATSVGQSISGAARTADTAKEGILFTSQPTGSERPTTRQRRRAFTQAMEDPRYFAALEEAGEDPALLDKAESLFGPKAKLDVIRAPIESGNRQAREESLAQQERLKDSPTYIYGKAVVEAGKEIYPTNPYLDTKLESKLTRSLGSTAPNVALGLVPGVGLAAGVTQYAMSQSEDMAQEALDAGRPELATQAATAGLFIGALSEATLGATARLKSILQNPTRVAALESWAAANPIKAATLAVSIREGAQEGVEQVMQNLTASNLVGYDPKRPWHQNVLEAAGLGAATGALLGGGAAAVTRRRPTAAAAAPSATDNPYLEGEKELAAAAADLAPAERSTELQREEPQLEPAPVQTSAPVTPAEPAPEILTPGQVMSREAVDAMAELRAMKAQRAAAPPSPSSPDSPPTSERPAATIEPPTTPEAASNAPAAPEPDPAIGSKFNANAGPRRSKLQPRPDGIPDVLDTIEELGGIKAPGTQKGAGEYDAYESAFGTGPARALRGGTQRPDVLLQQVNGAGWNFENVDQMYDAVLRASSQREALEAEAKEANTVRSRMVDRVQAMYDAALAGQPVTQYEVAELDSRLNERERKLLKAQLVKLLTLAEPVSEDPDWTGGLEMQERLDQVGAPAYRPSHVEAVAKEYRIPPEDLAQVLDQGNIPYQGELPLSGAPAQAPDVGRPQPVHPLASFAPADFAREFAQSSTVSSIDQDQAPPMVPTYNVNGTVIETPAQFAQTLMALRSPNNESLKVVILNSKDRVVHSEVMYAGTLDTISIDARDFVRLHAKHGKKGNRMLMSHNHPSGEVSPSQADSNFTSRVQLFAKDAGFEIVDHVITNGENYYTFKGQNIEPISKPELAAWEKMPRSQLRLVDTDAAFNELVKSLRHNATTDTVHIIYLNTRRRATAVERLQPDFLDEIRKAVLRGIGTESAAALLIDFGPSHTATEMANVARAISRSLEAGATTARLLDWSALGMPSARVAGYMTKDAVQLKDGPERTAVDAAKDQLRQAWADLQTLGIMADPKRDAEKAFAFYKALFKLATAYARHGVKTAAEFAERLGMELNAVITAAWDDAAAGKPKSSPMHLEPGAVAELVDGARDRKFSLRFDADPRMAADLRAAAGNRTYLPIGNELTVTQALGIIQEQGLDAAIGMMKDERNRDLSDRERVALGQAIVTKLNHEYAQTKSELALDKAVDVAEWLTEYGTRLGQGVQAFAIWNHLTPDGYVRAYVKAVADARRKRKPGAPSTEPPPAADAETKKKIHKMATEAMRKPKGFQRDQALIDVLAAIARAKGLNKFDMVIALWYANLLSGWTTQVRNLVGNLSNVIAETMSHGAVRPLAVPSMLAGLYNGAMRGAFDAANIVRTGKVSGTRLGKLEAPRALELIHFSGLAYPLNAWKYVFRVMAATDMVFFRSAEEMRARFIGREIARAEGLRGNALTARLAELLHHTAAAEQRAAAQARAEQLTGNAARRRVGELIEQARPEALVGPAAEYGRFATFNQVPEGVLGVFARGIRAMSGQFPPLRLVVPFTNIVANVTNTALNFSPWGYRRLFPAMLLEQNWMSPTATPLDYQLQAARATLGTIGLAALYALAIGYKDDEDPPFAITGNGPQDPRQRNQLKETGWQPYSVKVGDHYVGYRETPLHLGLAYLGSQLDASRYKQLDERDLMTRAAYGLQQVGTALLNQSFLKSLGDFFESLGNDQVPRTGARLGGLGRTASGIVAPNLAKQIDKLFDPTVYDGSTIEGALLRDVPVARRYLKPAVNVLGDAIRADPFYSVTRPDELWSLLARKQSWISTPSRTTMIGERTITPEEYYDWIVESGPPIRRRLEILIPALEISTPERAQDLVDDVVTDERRRARARLGIAR